MKSNVLIISYSMPPSSDIGGRRWVKFAKFLKRAGHKVKIIAAIEDADGISSWEKDARDLAADIYFSESSYPKFLGIRPKNLPEKILYRLSLVYARVRSRGNYYDKSNYWKKNLLSLASKLIREHKIKNVICTIPPFHMAFDLLDLKEEFPELNFIVDYRDPWTNNKTSFGFDTLKGERLATEVKMEKEVVDKYNSIIGVSGHMAGHLKELCSTEDFDKKFKVIPNGFDAEDFDLINDKPPQVKDAEIKIVFAGTFYEKSAHVLHKVMDTINRLEKQYPESRGHLKFIFIGYLPESLRARFTKNEQSFIYLGRKNLAETFSMVRSANYCSLFLSDDLDYSFSTKFYEYIALRKRILTFSRQMGANGKFVTGHGLGLAIDFGTMKEQLKDLYFDQVSLSDTGYGLGLDLEEMEVKNLSKKVEELLK